MIARVRILRLAARFQPKSVSGCFYEPKEGNAEVRQEHDRDRQEVQGIHGRGTNRDEGAHQELKAAARRGPRADKADEENAVLAKIGEMPEPERVMGKRLHAIIKASVPALSPRLWYGMPAYAKDGKVVCFFQSAQKVNTRDATLGFR